MAMLPPAPGLFSTTNCWPRPLLISAERARSGGSAWKGRAAPEPRPRNRSQRRTPRISTARGLSLVLRGGANRGPGFPENLAEYKRQDAAVLVVVHLDRRVDA